jgi:predicted ester cyclase
MLQDNRQVVRELYLGMINDGRLDLADRLLTAGYYDHSPMSPEHPGHEGFKQRIDNLRRALEARVSIDDLIADNNRVAFRWTISGRHVGEFAGLAPTGNAVHFTGLNFERLHDSQITAHWSEWDKGVLLDQLQGT